jgi:hypothetical protein
MSAALSQPFASARRGLPRTRIGRPGLLLRLVPFFRLSSFMSPNRPRSFGVSGPFKRPDP